MDPKAYLQVPIKPRLVELREGQPGYVKMLIGGLSITIRNFFYTITNKRKAVMRYPEEKWALPPGYRGFPKLVKNSTKQLENCVACKLCEVACPPMAIKIEINEIENPDEMQGRERHPARYQIDYGRCICCGFCEEACPEDAIYMSFEYECASYSRADLFMNKDDLFTPKNLLWVNQQCADGPARKIPADCIPDRPDRPHSVLLPGEEQHGGH